MYSTTTVQGESVGINIKNGYVHIEDATDENAKVVLPDVEASNGVVHVINKVLLPQEVLDILNPPIPNIVQLAQSVDDLSLAVLFDDIQGNVPSDMRSSGQVC